MSGKQCFIPHSRIAATSVSARYKTSKFEQNYPCPRNTVFGQIERNQQPYLAEHNYPAAVFSEKTLVAETQIEHNYSCLIFLTSFPSFPHRRSRS
jgi:hypothetical protein